jgi:putative salt-induced outer membrane protein YdiY
LHLKNGDLIIGTIKRVLDNEVTIDGRDNTIIKTTTGFRYEITDLLNMNVSLDWDHESQPAGAAEKTDTTFVIGAGLEFD